MVLFSPQNLKTHKPLKTTPPLSPSLMKMGVNLKKINARGVCRRPLKK
ncbi:hypothetical protein NIES2104_44590 [Leptolyngbya sp. NIES-2104]|nr:hypothetical protein NIES2104_44590 [Leptolyngbya sp. NIES-2104]